MTNINITHINKSSLESSVIFKSIDCFETKMITTGLDSSGSLCQSGVIPLYSLYCTFIGRKLGRYKWVEKTVY